MIVMKLSERLADRQYPDTNDLNKLPHFKTLEASFFFLTLHLFLYIGDVALTALDE